MADAEAGSEHHLAVLGQTSAGAPAVLLVPDGPGWRLPRLTSEDRASSETAELTRDARALLGADVSVLQCLLDAEANGGRARQQLHALEAHAARWTPPGGARWVAAAELDAAALTRPDLAAPLARWLDECGTGRFTARGRDWIRPGWRESAVAWVDAQLARAGLGRVTAIEQVKAWEYSQVLRLTAGDGVFYLKALCESAAREPELTRRLAQAHPAWMPDVVAVDAGRRWLLVRATAGPELLNVSDTAAWQETARRCARVQIAWTGRSGELQALGCPHWPVTAVAARLGPMLADGASLMAPCPEGLTGDELARLRRRAPELAEHCAELAALGVPDSLEHGDLWGTNVILGERGPVFIDWEDATVAHPFVTPSLLILTLPHSPAAPATAGLAARLRDAYLEVWQAEGPLRAWAAARLERAFDLAQRTAMLHYAVQFWLGAPLVETSWWVRTFAPFFLRRCLA